MVVGGSGGPRITTATISVILDVLAFGHNIKEAIYKPRVHHQLYPNMLAIEAEFPADIRDLLSSKYHHQVKKAKSARRANSAGGFFYPKIYLNSL
jgi:gamma-glutamyltranspeptidase